MDSADNKKAAVRTNCGLVQMLKMLLNTNGNMTKFAHAVMDLKEEATERYFCTKE
ncbi:hypothetical protein CHS0354_024452 [Potamilus streckersoni]|uniref:Uncharacterized protein n=1 Tax=Potamilus streckersoni TaxID=2493646 RepID=A0AAE0TMY9_9BIVA|nr:hypothetical protein CHS0354_024452 [Potamilus streckersoni]